MFCSNATDSTLSVKSPTKPSGTTIPSPTRSAGLSNQTSFTASYVPALNVAPVGTLPILITSITSEPSVSFTDVVIVRGIVVPSSPAAAFASKFGTSATASTITLNPSFALALMPASGSVATAVATKPLRSISSSPFGVNVNTVSNACPAGKVTVHVPVAGVYVPTGAEKLPHAGSIPVTVTVKNSTAEAPMASCAVIGTSTVPSSFTRTSSTPLFTLIVGGSITGHHVSVNSSEACALLSVVSNSPSDTGFSVVKTVAVKVNVPK